VQRFLGFPPNISANFARTGGTLQSVAETGNHLYDGWRGEVSLHCEDSLLLPLQPHPVGR
jgi:hypothetical protein